VGFNSGFKGLNDTPDFQRADNRSYLFGYSFSSDSYEDIDVTIDTVIDAECFYPSIISIRDEYYFSLSGRTCINGRLTFGKRLPCVEKYGMTLSHDDVGRTVTCSELSFDQPRWWDNNSSSVFDIGNEFRRYKSVNALHPEDMLIVPVYPIKRWYF